MRKIFVSILLLLATAAFSQTRSPGVNTVITAYNYGCTRVLDSLLKTVLNKSRRKPTVLVLNLHKRGPFEDINIAEVDKIDENIIYNWKDQKQIFGYFYVDKCLILLSGQIFSKSLFTRSSKTENFYLTWNNKYAKKYVERYISADLFINWYIYDGKNFKPSLSSFDN